MNKNIIGENAGKIWHLLGSRNKKWEYEELKKASGLPDRDLAAAIGWLAREDKVQFYTDRNGGKEYLYLVLNFYIG